MAKKKQPQKTSTIKIHLDTIPNLLNNPIMGKEEEKNVKQMFRSGLERKLNDMIIRYKSLPPIMVHLGKYSEFLIEARDLFIKGSFYPCIAMCGITAERIGKELLRRSVLLRKKGNWAFPSDEQAAILDHIRMNDAIGLLIKSSVIDKDLKSPFQKLTKIRNKYVHAGGKDPKQDSQEAIKHLHTIIEGTVSVFKHYEIQKGKLVLKKTK